MAILYNNEYYKIISVDNDYLTNRTSVTLHKYAFPEDRLFEKEHWIDADVVKSNVLNYIDNSSETLAKKAYSICDLEGLDKTMDFVDFLNLHPEFKIEYDLLNNVKVEGKYIVDNLLSTNGIDYESLQYKEVWSELGLTKALCTSISVSLVFRLMLSDFENDVSLANLYSRIKEDFYVGAEDI